MPVTDIRVLKETKKYKITLCDVDYNIGNPSRLERLELKLGKKLVFVQNFYHYTDEKNFEKHSEALHLAKSFKPKQGWFKIYGQGSPLDQFKKEFDFKWSKTHKTKIKDFDQLQHPSIDKQYEDVSRFHGNHKAISSAFSFIIWGEKLEKVIRKYLKINQEIKA